MATFHRLVIHAVCLVYVALRSTHCIHVNAQCFCLSLELDKLRNPIHIEPTLLNDKQVYVIAEQLGVIQIYDPAAESEKDKLTHYIDVSDRVVCDDELYEESGLLGFALHPQFTENKKLYTYSIRTVDNKNYAVISEITDTDVNTEKLLLLVEQPGDKRNGGQLLFGQDGYLYIFVGDGGPADASEIQSQNGSSLLGKILRVDVDRTVVEDFRLRHYDIPPDNPMLTGWQPEIYAIGIRHIWRCWEDSGHTDGTGLGRIFCADLGSKRADEMDIVQKGVNYGWPYKEGNQCVAPTPDLCNIDNEALPIKSFPQNTSGFTAIVTGPLYRGKSFPELYGNLMFGDYMTSSLWSLREDSTEWSQTKFVKCDESRCACDHRHHRRSALLSFGQTHDGEILLLMTEEPHPYRARGAVLKLQPSNKSGAVTCGASATIATNLFYNTFLSIFLCIITYCFTLL